MNREHLDSLRLQRTADKKQTHTLISFLTNFFLFLIPQVSDEGFLTHSVSYSHSAHQPFSQLQ